jgi:hypothetical protein
MTYFIPCFHALNLPLNEVLVQLWQWTAKHVLNFVANIECRSTKLDRFILYPVCGSTSDPVREFKCGSCGSNRTSTLHEAQTARFICWLFIMQRESVRMYRSYFLMYRVWRSFPDGTIVTVLFREMVSIKLPNFDQSYELFEKTAILFYGVLVNGCSSGARIFISTGDRLWGTHS